MRMQSCSMEIFKDFAIALIHPAETSELSLCPIPVTMMIATFRRELATRDGIDHLDAGYHLHRERQGGFPAGRETFLVLQIEVSGRGVSHTSRRTHVVIHLAQHVGLDTTGKIEKEHVRTRQPIGITAPEDAPD